LFCCLRSKNVTWNSRQTFSITKRRESWVKQIHLHLVFSGFTADEGSIELRATSSCFSFLNRLHWFFEGLGFSMIVYHWFKENCKQSSL
jgi:hypothetical protein